MKGHKVLTSKDSDEWKTPRRIISYLKDQGFKIGWDLACTHNNVIKISRRACVNFNEFTIQVCKKSLDPDEVAYCNPPYSQVRKFVQIIFESEIPCIMLLPARTDTRWFHDFIYLKPQVRIEFLKGRLRFSDAKYNAPFPSILVYINLNPK